MWVGNSWTVFDFILILCLQAYIPQLSGIGLCVVNLMDDMQEYTRGLFLIMYVQRPQKTYPPAYVHIFERSHCRYCGPAVLLSYLYIRTSQELRPPDGPFAVMMYEHRVDLRMRQR